MNNLDIFVQLEKEIQVDDQGIGSASKRGLARMCGVKYQSWSQGDSIFNKEIDEYLAGKGFNGDSIYLANGKIIDTICALVIKFYARKNEVADCFLDAYLTIGIRSTFQKVKGWQQRKKYSRYLLKEPRVWTKVFGDDFYDELSRITGLEWDRKTHKRPCYFAGLTYDLVYSYLPKEVYSTIKQNQKQHGGYIQKIHQYLTADGLIALQNHLQLTMNILTAAASEKEARRMIYSAVTGEYQLSMF